MTACVCPPTGWLDPECPKHGLPGATRFPPMDRHARMITVTEEHRCLRRDGFVTISVEVTRKETAAEVQRRLYGESRPA